MSVPNLTQGSLNTAIKPTFDDTLSPQIKWIIVDRLLGGMVTGPALIRNTIPDHEVYFDYYTEQCNQALHDGKRHVSARTHHDIVEMWEYFKDGVPREDIIRILTTKLPAHRQASDRVDLANGTIDLAAWLCLMMEGG